MNIPGAVYRQKTAEVNVEVRINEQGFRHDYAIKPDVEPHTCRLALFGDSFSMGYEVELENSFGSRLRDLGAAIGLKLEILNLSVSGFGTAESLRVLEEVGEYYQPDIVLFQWHRTDIEDNLRSDLYRLSDDQLIRGADSYLPAIEVRDALMEFWAYRWLISNSHFYVLLRERAARSVKKAIVSLKRKKVPEDTNIELRPNPTKSQYSEKLTARLLEAAQAASARIDAPFFVIEIPGRDSTGLHRSTMVPVLPYIQEELSVINPSSAFDETLRLSGRPLFFEKGHGHLNLIGNEVLARETLGELSSRKVFEKCDANNIF
jgi:hypothetical protein